MLLMVDNYDSFTYNLVQYFGELGEQVEVFRNDEISAEGAKSRNPDAIVISPGPCTPNKAGMSLTLIEAFTNTLPILGVCLGHQCIGQAFGGRIVHAKNVVHGKVSQIHHSGGGIFESLHNPFSATRYHSLVIDKRTLPSCLEVTAWTEDSSGNIDEIMAIRHRDMPIIGLQFHPESIATQHGHELLQNFLRLTRQARS